MALSLTHLSKSPVPETMDTPRQAAKKVDAVESLI
jgi:hypothetical protein